MITRLDNSGLKKRRALVDVDGKLLAEFARVMGDAGFLIVSSAPPPIQPDGVVRLVIEGDALPEECDQGPVLVKPVLVQEVYGDQRMVKVERISVGGKPSFTTVALS